MTAARAICFEGFRLEPENARLWHGEQAIALTPKAFDLLALLASRAGEMITKEELLARVWDDVLVTDASLVVCIREIRNALDDKPRQPRFIETVHRRGYRFIAQIADAEKVASKMMRPSNISPNQNPLSVIPSRQPMQRNAPSWDAMPNWTS